MFLTESEIQTRKASSVVETAIAHPIAPEFFPNDLDLRSDLACQILLVVIPGKSA
ncbi:hypothetical protein ACQ4M3_15770 [Leptolyngbya sp. AN03gr2]|uniref:hypothetical protein n=1 Tax=unclassified Leptolyngbya TaxID=2650499 RepID=UPI003D31F2B2